METISGDLTAVDYFAKGCLHIQCVKTINEATQFIYSFEEMHSSGVSICFNSKQEQFKCESSDLLIDL